jgi:phosphoketolase
VNKNTITLTPDLLQQIDAYWCAANYLSVGQIYLFANPLLKRPLALSDIKHMLLGHWGTTPGQNFIYVYLNRVIKKYDLDVAVEVIKRIQHEARVNGYTMRPRWPMIVLKSPKGWTGPQWVDGVQIEGTFRAHQVPLSDLATHPERLKLLEEWLRSYRPGELFDEQGKLKPELAELAPKGNLKIRVVNVVDLMRLQPEREHPHGMSDTDFDKLFTKDKPVIFAFHAYPWLIHRLTYRRTNHHNIHVRGYKEEGTITTPFDMTVLNDLDRFHLVMDTIDRLPQTGDKGRDLKTQMKTKLIEHKQYIDQHGQDMPEIRNWKWSNPK